MQAKEFLNQAFLIDQRIRSKSEQIRTLHEIATSCSANITGMPRNPNRGGSRMADAVCKMVDLENEIARDMDALIAVKRKIVVVINAVDDITLRTLLEKRYLCSATWEDISCDLCFNKRWTLRLHDRALEAVQKILDKN